MRLNLESNKITASNDFLEHTVDSNTVQCLHLPWESAAENGLQQINPDIVEANLSVLDITERAKPFSLLPYAKSYQPSSIKLLCISYLPK
ncbi:unnamed protein product [Cuscuta campestris]|uniref:Uncharacterized protein n=1 Tax=Cuscuta campestris TaxID=132261 RepID=A0A484NG09_9ASTE|nr:unnamed protein product [Cuscuta campestris]